MKIQKTIVAIAAISLLAWGCSEDKTDPVIPNEEELITTLIYTLVEQGGTDTVTMRFQDIDGPGGNDPITIGGVLKANSTYLGTVQLLNEQEEPAEDITEEVAEEALEHQFFYQPQLTLNSTVAYADADIDGHPIGIETVFTTTVTSSGQLTIILRHEPNKTADGVAGGDPTNAGGETDIEVTFDVDVQ